PPPPRPPSAPWRARSGWPRTGRSVRRTSRRGAHRPCRAGGYALVTTSARHRWGAGGNARRGVRLECQTVTMKTKLILPPTGPYLVRRFTHLMLGLVLFGSGIGMMLNSRLGVPPWDVLHQGLARALGMTVGIWSIIVSGIVLLGWLPLREPYGVGTLLNGVVIGAVLDLSGLLLPEPDGLTWRIAMLVAGIVTVGFGSGLYIGAQLGPGPRDG